MCSVQLTVNCQNFGEVIGWLNLNRKGLIVFIHPMTGDDLKDHTDYAMWMGDILKLNLQFL